MNKKKLLMEINKKAKIAQQTDAELRNLQHNLKAIEQAELASLHEEAERIKPSSHDPVPFDHIRHRRTGRLKKLGRVLKEKFKFKNIVGVHIEMANGFHTTILAVLDADNSFKYNKRRYVVDEESKYYDTSSKLWFYDFHEDISIPIKRKIDVLAIKKVVNASNITDVEMSLNPRTLEHFQVAKIAEGIMRAASIDAWIKRIQAMLVFILILSIISVLTMLYNAGVFDKIKPG